MNRLTGEQILFIHARLIEETGGGHGVRDVGLLAAAVARPWATFGGDDLYPGLFLKAAALLTSLIGNHPFIDGNKRTGIAAAALFLRRNGCRVTSTNQELETFALHVAAAKPDVPEVAAWLESHSSPAT